MTKPVSKITLEEMLQEVERELNIRKPFYQKQIEYRKMSRDVAIRQYNRLLAVKHHLETEIKKKGVQKGLFNT
jgi:YesN/AraC family two-component response regulator